MPASRMARGESVREAVEPWRPKVLRLSEETKQALLLLESIHSWGDLVRVCNEQQGKREKRGF